MMRKRQQQQPWQQQQQEPQVQGGALALTAPAVTKRQPLHACNATVLLSCVGLISLALMDAIAANKLHIVRAVVALVAVGAA